MGKMIDLTGLIFERLTVIKLSKRENNKIFWLCKCSCGNIKEINGASLRNKSTRSCGCLNREMSKLKNTIDLTGMKFGRLTVIKRIDIKRKGVGYYIYWECKCDCGSIKNINGQALSKGKTVSCGCYNKEKNSKKFLIDLTGQKIGKLTIISRAERPKSYSSGTYWNCVCECGNEVVFSLTSVRNKKSCGCYKKNTRKYSLPYGQSSFNNLYRRYKNDAKFRGIIFLIKKDEFEKLTKDNCFYCGIKPSQVVSATGGNGEYIYNGIDRINNDVGYILSNIVTCCKTCNMAKRNQSPDEFYQWIKRAYEKIHFEGLI